MLSVGLVLLLAILFRAFILEYVAAPLALVLWVFWRLLQSVDQTVYWILLILIVLFAGLGRLIRLIENKATVLGPTSRSDSKAILERVRYWRNAIRLASPGTAGPYTVEHHLGEMLAELYASQQPNATYFEVYTALKEHRLPLPEPIDAFLFPSEPTGSGRSFKQVLRTIWDMSRKQIDRWTGREVANYYRSLEQALTFMESSLEHKS